MRTGGGRRARGAEHLHGSGWGLSFFDPALLITSLPVYLTPSSIAGLCFATTILDAPLSPLLLPPPASPPARSSDRAPCPQQPARALPQPPRFDVVFPRDRPLQPAPKSHPPLPRAPSSDTTCRASLLTVPLRRAAASDVADVARGEPDQVAPRPRTEAGAGQSQAPPGPLVRLARRYRRH